MIDTLAIDGVTIHDAGTIGRALALTSASGFGTPAPRSASELRPRRHGERDRTAFYPGRLLALEGVAKGATPADAWAAVELLEGALALNGTDRLLVFTRSGIAYQERALVRVAGALEYSLAGLRKRIKWAVALRAADPRFYADAETTASYSPSTAGSGVVFPLRFPLSFEGAADATMTLHNGGNVSTPPVWTITGPATTPGIRNETTGEELVTTATLLAGETLTIDVAARQVIAAGGTLRPDLLDPAASSWFELGAGDSVVRLTGSGFATGQTELAATFRDARI